MGASLVREASSPSVTSPSRCWDNRGVSPRSRGRPPSRGRRRQLVRRPAGSRGGPRGLVPRPGDEPKPAAGETDCWFDEPDPADRRSWAVPPGHGTYQGLDLELLDPADEAELTFLIEAQHTEFEDAVRSDEETIIDGEPFSPRLHIAMHQIVASQLLADQPPQTWLTVQRLSALGYDWHNIMHMIASVVSDDVHRAVQEHRRFDPGDYARRLNELPGDWPPPRAIGQH
jgi:Domain of unknown function (DUF1841)